MKPPLVSIVMATYNRAHWVGGAIESMLNQSYDYFEFLVINDGSTDDTNAVLANYARQDKRIKLFNHKNSGGAASRNKGLRYARGKYIAMMDDDDISLPQRLARQVAFLEEQPDLSACVCDNYNVLDSKQLKKKRRKHSRLPCDEESLKTKLALPFILGPMTLITRQAIRDCNGHRPIFTSAQDLDLTLRFQEKFQAGVVREFLYQYRVPELQLGANVSTHSLIGALHCHIAAYTSAWYRRNRGTDPLNEGWLPSDMASLALRLPLTSRKRIIRTMTPIVKRFNRLPNLSIEEMAKVIEIINLLNPRTLVKQRFKFRQARALMQTNRWLDIPKLSRL